MSHSFSSGPPRIVASEEMVAQARRLYERVGEKQLCSYFAINCATLARFMARLPVARVTARHVETRLAEAERADINF